MRPDSPLQALTEEHRLLERVLRALETRALDTALPFPRQYLVQALDFLSTFVDRCHSIKEEERLFPLLWERGVPLERGPLGLMMNEHGEGRQKIEAIRRQLAEPESLEAVAIIRSQITDYVSFMRRHIQREEERIFNIARSLLGRHDMKRLEREFEEVEREQIGSAFHEQYLALARRLSGPVRGES